jgi:hypothetical protein
MHSPTGQFPAILLLCLGPARPDATSSPKTPGVTDLVQVFCPFGDLRKIVIFSRAPSAKAFLEFSLPAEALFAREFLHESSINDFGRAHIVFSKQRHIEPSNELLDYWDVNSPTTLKSLSRQSTDYVRVGDTVSADEPSLRQLSLQLVPSNGHYSPTTPLNYEPPIQIFSKSQNFPSNKIPTFSGNFSLESKAPSLTFPRPFQARVSKVILASNLEHFFDSSVQLFNFFSCFGNLSKVLLMKNLQKALLQYTAPSGAKQCMDYFADYPLEEMALRVNFSKYSKIDLANRSKSENSQQFNDVFVVPTECHHFPETDPMSQTLMPSTVLLVLAEIREAGCSQKAACEAIGAIRDLGVQLIDVKHETKNHNAILQITVGCLRDAIRIVSKLHRAIVGQCVLNVQFF